MLGMVQESVAWLFAGMQGRGRELGARMRAVLLPWLRRGSTAGRLARIDSGCQISVTDGGRLDIDDGASLGSNCHLTIQHGRLSIGRQTFIGPFTVIAVREEVAIGDGVLIAERVTIRDQDHEIHDPNGVPIAQAGFRTAPVVIGSDVWIGAGAVILKGVTIGSGAVVAANAVVNRNVATCEIVGGVPARHLGFRELPLCGV